jgi:hypothetical protein
MFVQGHFNAGFLAAVLVVLAAGTCVPEGRAVTHSDRTEAGKQAAIAERRARLKAEAEARTPAPEGPSLTVTGTIVPGLECAEMLADDGRRFSLPGLPGDVGPGARVRVSGPIVEHLYCRGPALRVDRLDRL